MAFPTDLDDQSAGDIIESADRNAIVAKIGINDSDVTTSLDYLLKSTSSGDPGHLHTKVGTIATGVWNGTAIPVAYGGTGSTSASAARTALGLGASDDVEFDLITSSVESSSNAIDVTQTGGGRALYLSSDTSTASNAVFRIVNNSEDMASKAQYNEIYPTLTVGASKGWTNTHIASKTSGTDGYKNTSYMRGLLLESYGGGDSSDNGQDLSELVSIYNAYGVYSGAGTVDSIYGLLLEPYSKTGSVGTMYDLYFKTRVGGGSFTGYHWAIYQEDSNDVSYFAGEVRVGGSSNLGNEFKIQVVGGAIVTGEIDATGTGIRLGDDANALLDDYEEGAFDIGVTQGTVASSSKGKYIKVGNKVTVWCQVDSGTDTTNAAILKLTGMPFAAVSPNTTGHGGVGAVSYTNYMGGNVISAVIEATTTTVFFSKLDATDLLFSDCTSTWSVRFTITYQTT